MKRDVGIQIDQVNARMAISLCAEAAMVAGTVRITDSRWDRVEAMAWVQG